MAQPPRWTEKAANEWYAKQPWLVGSNYLPATAINQLEMWQAETFDPVWIETELTWAEGLGMNTMRVFLHDLPWKQDSAGVPAPDRQISEHRRQAQDQADLRAVRFLLGPIPGDQRAAGAASRACTIRAGCRARARRR